MMPYNPIRRPQIPSIGGSIPQIRGMARPTMLTMAIPRPMSTGWGRTYTTPSGEMQVYDKIFDDRTMFGANAQLVDEINTPIPQNSSISGRLGHKLTMHTVSIRFVYHGMPIRPGAVSTNDQARNMQQLVTVSLIYDNQPQGAKPAVEDIYTDKSALAFMRLDNTSRFKVIRSETFEIDPLPRTLADTGHSPQFSGTNTNHLVEWNVDLNKDVSEMQFAASDTGGSIGNIRKGALYLVSRLLHDQSPAAPDGQQGVFIRGRSRLRFTA